MSFDVMAHKTERSAVAVLMHWMRDIIKEKNLGLGLPDVETTSSDHKLPDTVIYESEKSRRVLCLIEAKPPYFNVFDESELKEPARLKATMRKAPYFALCNFKRLIWFKTDRVNALKPDEEQILDKYTLSEIDDLDELEHASFREPTKRRLEEFLVRLHNVATGSEPEPKQAVDEYLIFRLHEKIRVLTFYYKQIIETRCHQDPAFKEGVVRWFSDQGWSFTWLPVDFEKAARQTAYLLVNKIVFYSVLQAQRPQQLDPLELPANLTKGSVLQSTLQAYFSEVLRIDYETVYTSDFLDTVAFPDAVEIVREVNELVSVLKRYNFAKLGYEIIGRIFERLIPKDERHKLGQYFTSPDVVDLILGFCLRHEDDQLLDPSCGAGTFLVRAYQHKRLMNASKGHAAILATLWGNDIAKFPAHLATINLAINDLSVNHNYPNILQEDFFKLPVGDSGFELPKRYWRRLLPGLSGKHVEVAYPRQFDAIVGNPPYTRQEEIPHIAPDELTYKRQVAKRSVFRDDKRVSTISERAGIHAYFFLHGTKFLRDNGLLGFVVASSWLDTVYGQGLQEFFLENYRILTIIESRVERWFEEADVNTCIVILEKCGDPRRRMDNIVRFVSLKSRLDELIPRAADMWEKQIERLRAIGSLKRTILAHEKTYENHDLRVYTISQAELWDEGYNPVEHRYIGTSWGKYLRAPDVFFSILKSKKELFCQVRDVARVRFGVKTGANDFFYLTEDQISALGIERKFIRPVIFSLKEISGYKVDKSKLKYHVIICNRPKNKLVGTQLLKYIQFGEKQGYHKKPTCAQRAPNPWYGLARNWEYAPLVFPAKVGERMPVFVNANVLEDKKLYGILPNKDIDPRLLAAILNCTLTRFFLEFTCRQLTGAQAIADIDVIVVQSLPTLDVDKIDSVTKNELISAFEELAKTEALSIFEEIGSNPTTVRLDAISKPKRTLDKIIMGKILRLSDSEQLDVYKSLVDLVRKRLDKAKSFDKNARVKEGLDVEALADLIVSRVNGSDTIGAINECLLTLYPKVSISRKVELPIGPAPEIRKGLFGWELFSPKVAIACGSENEALYLKLLAEVGFTTVRIPKSLSEVDSLLAKLQAAKRVVDNVLDFYVDTVNDHRSKIRIRHKVYQALFASATPTQAMVRS